ncbi:DUF1800 domain-containing protein [Sphingomonas sp. Leaf21]|uniref:DUF1800 domain-containing protein n=1 Tax=Sphingomonas sp. Leaf21 TaxID=2876550 RepID=UPI001E3761AC|nr:DUF1800 domain-containing protein [Sphingomonas sp. Leaf21]
MTVLEDGAVPNAATVDMAAVAPVDRADGATGVVPLLALAACGDGGGASGGGSSASGGTTTVVVVNAAPTATEASRFLAQASMGATRAMIDTVVSRGYDGWLSDQFALPRATTHWDWMTANGYDAAANRNTLAGFDPSMWRQMIVEPDQLRQRIGMALLDILVVGIDGVTDAWRAFSMAAYVDLLLDNAFGNYRDLLGAITTNFAMATYLTFLNNRKANPTTGLQPDENYARELMQLFTLGLYQLNMDGSVKTNGGQPIETYGQADVSGLARIFTGLSPATSDSTTTARYRQPLVMNAAINETGASSFLGTTVTGGGMAGVTSALDTIFAHPNIPPFVARQLIQRLVTSNPSPAYINRVASRFADNGQGVRGDMKAVIRAILLDSEARSLPTAATAGKLREPVLRLTGWARAFAVNSPSGAWAIGDTSNPSTRLGQAKGHSPSVFNFYRPGYTPPGTSIAAAGLVAPEFQITNEQSVVAYVNYMYGLIANGTGDVKADYSAILTKAADSQALVDEVNLVLAAGQLSATTVTAIRTAVDTVSATATNGPVNRVGIAVLLAMASPDYLTLR